MKILLDENIPRKVKFRLSEFDVSTVQEMGWAGLNNGKLLKQLLEADFAVLITLDKGFKYQQNFGRYTIPVISINSGSGTYEHILPLLDKVKELLHSNQLKNGVNTIVED